MQNQVKHDEVESNLYNIETKPYTEFQVLVHKSKDNRILSREITM